MGTEKRRLTVDLPPKLAEICGQDTVTITEERDGLSGAEIPYWWAFYEIEKERQKKGE